MKPILFLLLIAFSFTSCDKKSLGKSRNISLVEEKVIDIKNVDVLKKELIHNPNKGRWYHKEKPFNGYSLKFHENGTLEEKWGFYNGRREGIARRWRKNETLQLESYYKNNRLTGVYKTWHENGTLASQSFYENGLKQGLDKKWFSNGQLAKLRNLVDDKENGIQKAWLENGKLYVNYEAKNGRMFGMRRANSCYRLEDEVIIRNKKL
jgi:antitoxin component YwqK of YwqJK toxin-antitoxin module